MYQEGQTATNPKTGQRVVFRGGQWVNAGMAPGAARPPPRLTPQEQIQLKEARESANSFGEIANQADQFVRLNRKAGTGPVYRIPGAEFIGEALNPNVAQMNALTARMAPAQRQPGSGTTSDRDLSLFLKAIPNVDRPGEANAAIARDMRQMADRRAQRAQFFDRYAQERGTLLGAEEAFAQFIRQQGARQSAPRGGVRRYNPKTGRIE